MSSPIDLSIVIPAHNEERYLGETVVALRTAIESVGVAAELIVANDASTDRTGEIADEFQCVRTDVELRNIGAVRNAGAKLARGRWLLFVDADTIVPPETLAATVKALRDGYAGGGAIVAAENIERFPLVKRCMYQLVSFGWQKVGRWAAGCYMFCQEGMFREFGGFDETVFAAEEYFFSRQVRCHGRFILVRPPVVTSSRKLAAYSTWELLRIGFYPILVGPRILRSRKGLEILYDAKR